MKPLLRRDDDLQLGKMPTDRHGARQLITWAPLPVAALIVAHVAMAGYPFHERGDGGNVEADGQRDGWVQHEVAAFGPLGSYGSPPVILQSGNLALTVDVNHLIAHHRAAP